MGRTSPLKPHGMMYDKYSVSLGQSNVLFEHLDNILTVKAFQKHCQKFRLYNLYTALSTNTALMNGYSGSYFFMKITIIILSTRINIVLLILCNFYAVFAGYHTWDMRSENLGSFGVESFVLVANDVHEQNKNVFNASLPQRTFLVGPTSSPRNPPPSKAAATSRQLNNRMVVLE